MPPKTAIKVVSAILLVSATAAAADAAVKWKDRASHWTGVSGSPTGTEVEMEISSGGEYGERVVRQIDIQEHDDRPCEITMHTGGLPNSNGGTGKQHIGVTSDPDYCDGQKKSVNVGEEYYATALQVCTNDKPGSSKLRVKGLKLWGGAVDTKGKITPNATPAKFELPNCAKWHAKVSCGEGEVITGIRGLKNSPDGFGGIAARCSPLVTLPK